MIEEVEKEGEVVIHRMPVTFSSYHAVLEPLGEFDAPPALLITTHGYGQSCRGFIKNFEALREKNVLIVAPQGINQFYWKNGRPGFSWMTSHMREYTIQDNIAYMGELVESLSDRYPYDPDRIFMLGFSQGVAMAFRTAAAGHVEPRGVIACGGDLPPDVHDMLFRLDPFDALIVHGTEDEVVKTEKGEECLRILQEFEFPVESHFFKGGHDIPDDVVAFIGDWITARL